MKQNVGKADLDTQEYNEVRKRIDRYFNSLLDEKSNFNSFYDRRYGILYMNFNIFNAKPIDKVNITLKIKDSE